MVHTFFLLSAFTASFINLIIALRTFIASKIEKKEHKKVFFLFFFGLFSIITILTWQGVISMIPYLASVISTFSYTFLNNIQMRKTAFASSFLWICNSYYFNSYYNIFAEFIRTTMILIGIYKLKK